MKFPRWMFAYAHVGVVVIRATPIKWEPTVRLKYWFVGLPIYKLLRGK